jgi:hypothetical protein
MSSGLKENVMRGSIWLRFDHHQLSNVSRTIH